MSSVQFKKCASYAASKQNESSYARVSPSIATSITLWIGVSLFLHFCLTCALMRPIGIRPPRVYLGYGSESVDAYFVKANPPRISKAIEQVAAVPAESLNFIHSKSSDVVSTVSQPPAQPLMAQQTQESFPEKTPLTEAESEPVKQISDVIAPLKQDVAHNPSHAIQYSPGEQSTFASLACEGTTVTQPTLNYSPTPRYPKHAREAGYEGTVRVEVSVDVRGAPTKVVLLESSGHQELDDCALKTIQKRWHFIPAESSGKKVPATVSIAVEFSLKNPI